MSNLLFGTIVSYSRQFKRGKMNLAGEPCLASFSLDTLRNIIAGFAKPEFAHIVNKTGLLLDNIDAGDTVVAEVKASYKSFQAPTFDGTKRVVEATNWAFSVSYNDALRIIRLRPVFEAVIYTLYDGTPTSVNQRRVIARGTAIQLQADHPRGAVNDKLAAEKGKEVGYMTRCRFYRVSPEGRSTIEQVPDPRVDPAGRAVQEYRPTNEQGLLLANASEIAMSLGTHFSSRQAVAA